MFKKLLVVCGPTATGKTKAALDIASKFKGELISADSRQVFKGFDIGSGKDIPHNSKFESVFFKNQNSLMKLEAKTGFYRVRGVKIWGYDLAEPDDNFSVAKYLSFAKEIIDNIWERGRLPIIVGGTGFYINALIDGFETIFIPPDRVLRSSLMIKSTTELYNMLYKLDKQKTESLNDSDSKNPRRLIRAIEVSKWLGGKKLRGQDLAIKYDSLLMLALKAPGDILYENVVNRVKKRMSGGFEKEMSALLTKGVDWKCQAMQGMGYRQYEDYYKKEISKDDFIRKWILEEQKYIKRQITWFKKDKRIVWFDITKHDFFNEVEKRVQSWYDYN